MLRAAQNAFDVLVTMDDNLPYQQNLASHGLAVAILRARSKGLEDLLDLMPELLRRLGQLFPGEVVRIYPLEEPPAGDTR